MAAAGLADVSVTFTTEAAPEMDWLLRSCRTCASSLNAAISLGVSTVIRYDRLIRRTVGAVGSQITDGEMPCHGFAG